MSQISRSCFLIYISILPLLTMPIGALVFCFPILGLRHCVLSSITCSLVPFCLLQSSFALPRVSEVNPIEREHAALSSVDVPYLPKSNTICHQEPAIFKKRNVLILSRAYSLDLTGPLVTVMLPHIGVTGAVKSIQNSEHFICQNENTIGNSAEAWSTGLHTSRNARKRLERKWPRRRQGRKDSYLQKKLTVGVQEGGKRKWPHDERQPAEVRSQRQIWVKICKRGVTHHRGGRRGKQKTGEDS